MKVDVIITVGSAVPTVRQATSVIPIVFAVANSVGSGLLKPLKIVTVSHSRSEPARQPPQSGHRQDRESATALHSETRLRPLPATSAPRLSAQHLLGLLMLTMQTAQHHAIAGASETAGSLVFRPRGRPPTKLHQAPSPLQRCAPSRLSTISGAAESKSLSRPASSSLDRPQYPLSEPSVTGARFCIRRQRLNIPIVFETRHPHLLSLITGRWCPPRSRRNLQVIAHVFAQTTPRPKLSQSRYSCFALVLYQPKLPEKIHGLSAVV